MSFFDVAADAYDRFMGRYSVRLSPQLADLADVRAGQRVGRCGCGPGALTAELVTRLGAGPVAAADPSEPFVAAARTRHPGVDIRHAPAEALPFDDDTFDAALAQLVVHFMADPVAGLREMARVTRPGGIVAASVWDHAGDGGPLAAFWDAAHDQDPTIADEGDVAGAREGHLATLFEAAGLRDTDRRSRPQISSIRRSRPGGSHSPSASGRPAPTCRAWLRRPVRTCANVVECDWAMARSRSGPVPGPPGAWPRPRGARSRRLGPARLEDDDGRPGRATPGEAVEVAAVPLTSRRCAHRRSRSSPSAARAWTGRGPSFRSTITSGCACRLSHQAGSPSDQPFIASVTRFGPSS